jgi:alpha-beta hydrolase superfamily lysophospholipase
MRARPSADLLITFLERLFVKAAGKIHSTQHTAPRSSAFSYKGVIIVAHSLGAVVSRLTLLDAYWRNLAWTQRTGLVLFAPAHSGAQILPLASLALGVLRLAPAEALARFRYQVLQDLGENSQPLVDLAEKTRKALTKGAQHLIAKRVVHAGQDKIVNFR